MVQRGWNIIHFSCLTTLGRGISFTKEKTAGRHKKRKDRRWHSFGPLNSLAVFISCKVNEVPQSSARTISIENYANSDSFLVARAKEVRNVKQPLD